MALGGGHLGVEVCSRVSLFPHSTKLMTSAKSSFLAVFFVGAERSGSATRRVEQTRPGEFLRTGHLFSTLVSKVSKKLSQVGTVNKEQLNRFPS